MIRYIENFLLIKLDIFIKVFSSDQVKAKLWNILVHCKWQVSSHFPQKPVKNCSDRERIGDD
jgi:hypothetical protein